MTCKCLWLKTTDNYNTSTVSLYFFDLLKGTHTVYFSSSFQIINQKSMMPSTDFHCMLFWVKFGNAFGYFCGFVFTSQMALLFNIAIQTGYILVARLNCAL